MDSLQLFPNQDVQLDYQELYHAVAKQIAKDLYPFVTMKDVPVILSSDWLYQELYRMLGEIIEHHNQSLGSIIYRVDLTEKLVRTTMKSANHTERLTELTALVLRREAQKVWIRHHYSG